VTVTIVGGIDIHRAQLTYDYVDLATGEVHTGRITPAHRGQLRVWLQRFQGVDDVALALEGCTGWRYVVQELVRAGVTAHVAEPAETALRGKKQRAKTDRADARCSRSPSGKSSAIVAASPAPTTSPPRRPGRYGVVLGRQTHPRPSRQARTAGAPVGVV